MSDSPNLSESFVRQFWPDEKSLNAHHRAIIAQARQHEREIQLSRITKQRLDDLTGTVQGIDGKVDEIKLALAVRAQEQENDRAQRKHRAAILVAVIAACATIIGAASSAITAAMNRPAAPPASGRTLTAQELEQLRLLEQRHGFRLGQQAPSSSP